MTKNTKEQLESAKIGSIQFKPFTKRDVYSMSVGEITEKINDKRMNSDQFQTANNVFSDILFGTKGNLDDPKSMRGKNIGHIKLKAPIVMPAFYKYLSKNYLATILNIGNTRKSVLSEIFDYKRFLVIKLEISGFTTNINLPEEESQEWKSLGLEKLSVVKTDRIEVYSVDYLTVSSGKESIFADRKDYILLSGGYALAYLLGTIDIENTLLSCQDIKGSSNSDMFIFREQSELIKNIISNGTIIDCITDVIPVTPAKYRDSKTCIVGGQKREIANEFNKLYSFILDKNSEIDTKTSLRTITNDGVKPIICFEDVYYLSKWITEDKSGQDMITKYYRELQRIPIREISHYMSEIVEKFSDMTAGVSAPGKTSQLGKLGGKYGDVRLAEAKRCDDTGRSVLSVDPSLRLDQIGLPYDMLKIWFMKELKHDCRNNISLFGQNVSNKHLENTIKYLANTEISVDTTTGKVTEPTFIQRTDNSENSIEFKQREFIIERLNEYLKQIISLFIRYPSLHKYNEMTMVPVLTFDKTIHLHPLVCAAYNADFDGDTGSVFLARLREAVEQAKERMIPSKNFLTPNGEPLHMVSQDAVLGLYYLSMSPNKDTEPIKHFTSLGKMKMEYESGNLKLHDIVSVDYPDYKHSYFEKEYEDYRRDVWFDETTDSKKIAIENENLISFECKIPEIDMEFEMVDGKLQCIVGEVKNSREFLLNNKESNICPHVETKKLVTSVGRFIYNSIIPQNMGFVDRDLEENRYALEIEGILNNTKEGTSKKIIGKIVKKAIEDYDTDVAKYIHDILKSTGYLYVTKSGMSISMEDIENNPGKKKIIDKYRKRVEKINKDKTVNSADKSKRKVNLWMACTDEVTDLVMNDMDIYNPLYLMAHSGARGNASQILQMKGIRGIMKDAAGNNIETPILESFTEGLSSINMFISSYGACKGMIDRANKTKYTGAATRDFVFGTTDQMIKLGDCGDTEGAQISSNIVASTQMDSGMNLLVNQKDINNAVESCSTDSPVAEQNYLIRPNINDNYIAFTPGKTLVNGEDIVLDYQGNIYTESQLLFNIYSNRVYNKYKYAELVEKGILQCETKLINQNKHIFNKQVTYNCKFGKIFINFNTDYTLFSISIDDNILFEEYKKFTDGKLAYSNDKFSKPISCTGFEIKETTKDGSYLVNKITGPMEIKENNEVVYKFIGSGQAVINYKDTGVKFYPYQAFLCNKLEEGKPIYDIAYTLDRYFDGQMLNKKTPEGICYKITNTSVKYSINNIILVELQASKLSDHLLGRNLAEDVYDKITGKLLIKRNDPIVKKLVVNGKKQESLDKILDIIDEQYIEGVSVRTPYTCKSPSGMCSRCYGYYYAIKGFARVGSPVCLTAAHSLGEPLSQSTMRTFHTGGAAAAGDIGDTFQAVQSLLIVGNIKDKQLENLLEKSHLVAENEIEHVRQCSNKALKNWLKDTIGNPIFNGTKLVGVDMQSLGIAKYNVYIMSATYLSNTLKNIFTLNGNNIRPIHYETITKQMLNLFRVVSRGDSSFIEGEIINFEQLVKTNIKLVSDNKQIVVVTPKVSNMKECAKSPHSPMKAFQYTNIKANTANAVVNYKKDDMINPITTILTGGTPVVAEEFIENERASLLNIPEVRSIKDILNDYRDKESEIEFEDRLNILQGVDIISEVELDKDMAPEIIDDSVVDALSFGETNNLTLELTESEKELISSKENIVETKPTDIETNETLKTVSAIGFGSK